MGNFVIRIQIVKAGIVVRCICVVPAIFCIHVPQTMTVRAAEPPFVHLLLEGYASLLASWGLCVIRIIVITLYQMAVTLGTNVFLWVFVLLARWLIHVIQNMETQTVL